MLDANPADPFGRPVVVAGLTLNGASVLRRLVRLGYSPWGVSFEHDEPGWHVRGARHHLTPHPMREPEAWVDDLEQFAGRFAEPPPVLAMSDVHVVAFDRAAARLEGRYRLRGFGRGLRTALTSKRTTSELASTHGFPMPASRWIENRDELAAFAEAQHGPVLIKPDLTYQWRRGPASLVAGNRKVMQASHLDALLGDYDAIAPHTPAVLAQEVIPGPDENLIYWCGLVGPEGLVGGRLIGRKLRIAPIHFGSATFVELVDAPQVEGECERFLIALGYDGLCGIELKEDPRDGVAKLIEVNPRYSLWDDIGIPVGVDLAHEAVQSLLGAPTRRQRPDHFRQKWVELVRDTAIAREYRREGLLTWWSWLWSLRPPIVVNDLPVNDPGYAWHMITRRLRKLRRSMGHAGVRVAKA